ncbi:glycosyltransferase family 2 protein [Actinopolymorpha alba]|uniref:glycosyltransferase family 2 protein n=1 Tax=Actinopolymorpha alba TaxID=533267 RepID=UPI000368E8D5|nr:glycosyltransferase family 2 protein [Actinopolymorpha alba]
MTRPEVSILLVSWNTLAETRRCLSSLEFAVNDGLRYEVIAVDNGSRDGSADLLASWPDLRLIRNQTNVGHSAAINQAYARSTGELILLLNSDITFHPGSLTALVSFLRTRPEAAGVAPRFHYRDSAKQHYYRLLTYRRALALTPLRRLRTFRRAYQEYAMQGDDFSDPRLVEMPSAACLLLRRTVLDRGQIFDERIPLYHNDVLLAHTLACQGLRLWMTPDSVVTHTVSASARLVDAHTLLRLELGGLIRYLQITQPRYRVWLFQLVAAVSEVTRRQLRRGPRLRIPDLVATLRGELPRLPDAPPTPSKTSVPAPLVEKL